MYKVTVAGTVAGYSETAVYIKVAENGSYIPCAKSEAGGVCVKFARENTDEDGNAVTITEDVVYTLTGGTLLGTEPEAEIEEVSGAADEDTAQ